MKAQTSKSCHWPWLIAAAVWMILTAGGCATSGGGAAADADPAETVDDDFEDADGDESDRESVGESETELPPDGDGEENIDADEAEIDDVDEEQGDADPEEYADEEAEASEDDPEPFEDGDFGEEEFLEDEPEPEELADDDEEAAPEAEPEPEVDEYEFEAVSCEPDFTLSCGQIVYLHNGFDGAPRIDEYDCTFLDESGPEVLFRFASPAEAAVTLTLDAEAADLDLFLLSGCRSDACLARGEGLVDEALSFMAEADEEFVVAVEGYAGATGDFALSVACEEPDGDIDPEGEAEREEGEAGPCAADFTIACGDSFAHDNATYGAARFEEYGCATYAETAPEVVYFFEAPDDCRVLALLTDLGDDLDFILLDACDSEACLDSSTNSDDEDEFIDFDVESGEARYLVVDGFLGSTSYYEISLDCLCADDVEEEEGDGDDEEETEIEDEAEVEDERELSEGGGDEEELAIDGDDDLDPEPADAEATDFLEDDVVFELEEEAGEPDEMADAEAEADGDANADVEEADGLELEDETP
ncbi:MAG: hypothetical protein C4523_18545 [Myxococcales bacterium]|nr:MAG: hypothetical protein C4523_18545 [Myxococcales bacterium]